MRPRIQTRDGRVIEVGCLPQPRKRREPNVYQLMGAVPDVATLAFTRGEARSKIATLIGVDNLGPEHKVEKIR